MPIPFLAGLGAWLGSTAGQTAVTLGTGLGKAIAGVRNRNLNIQRQDTQIQRLVADARAAGIHPLAALGSPVASSFGTPIGSTGAGDAIGDALSSAGLLKKQGALLDAQISSERAKAAALMAEAQSRTHIQSARRVVTDGGDPIPLWVRYKDRDGNILWGPNPMLPELEQMPVPAMIHGTDVVVRDQPPILIEPPTADTAPAVVETWQERQDRRSSYRRLNKTFAPWER